MICVRWKCSNSPMYNENLWLELNKFLFSFFCLPCMKLDDFWVHYPHRPMNSDSGSIDAKPEISIIILWNYLVLKIWKKEKITIKKVKFNWFIVQFYNLRIKNSIHNGILSLFCTNKESLNVRKIIKFEFFFSNYL